MANLSGKIAPIGVLATSSSIKDLSDVSSGMTPTDGQVLTYDTTNGWQAEAVFPSGTKMLFAQSAAPTGWTKDTTHDNKALRVVSGAAGSGGSLDFTTTFGSRTTTSTAAGGTVAGHTLTLSEIPSHSHDFYYGVRWSTNGGFGNSYYGTPMGEPGGHGITNNYTRGNMVLSAGSSGSHAHGFTGASHAHDLDMQVQYVDIIIATKD